MILMHKVIIVLAIVFALTGCSFSGDQNKIKYTTIQDVIDKSIESMNNYKYAGVDIVDKDYNDKQSSYKIDCIRGVSNGLSYIDDMLNNPTEDIKKWSKQEQGNMFNVFIKTDKGYVLKIEKKEPFSVDIWNFGNNITDSEFRLNEELVEIPRKELEGRKFYLIESLGYTDFKDSEKDTTYQAYYIDSETLLPECYVTYSYHNTDDVEETVNEDGSVVKQNAIASRTIYMQFYFYEEEQELAVLPTDYLTLEEYRELNKGD